MTPPVEPARGVRERPSAHQPRDAGGVAPGGEPAVVGLSSGEAPAESRREAEGARRQQQQQPQESPAATGYVERREVIAPQSAPPRRTPPPAPTATPKKAKEIPWP